MTSNCLPKNRKELKTLIEAVRVYSQDIGMEFGIEKCVMRIMRSENDKSWNEWNSRIKKKIRTLGEKVNYNNFVILEAGTIKQAETKEKNLKRVSLENEKARRNQAI